MLPTHSREYKWYMTRNNRFSKVVICKGDAFCTFTNNMFSPTKSTVILYHVSKNMNIPQFIESEQNQTWIFYEGSGEPINKSEYPANFVTFQHRFSFTMTYTKESDIHVPLYSWLQCPKISKSQLGNLKIPTNFSFAAGKTKLALWIQTPNEKSGYREKYIEELEKHIDVEIIGQKNSYICKNDCLNLMLNSTYMFLLIFEESLCKEHVSSPFLKYGFTANVVPVVLGLTNYDHILPAGSYINVLNYSSPQHLANHLLTVSQNNDLYNKYINAKVNSGCVLKTTDPICSLCEFLHQRDTKKPHHLGNLQDYWNSENLCYSDEQISEKLGI